MGGDPYILRFTMKKENSFITFINKMADLLILNLLFLICCVPVITIGPAFTALYAVSLRSVRYGDGYVVRTFFQAFKRDFLKSVVAGIIMLIMIALLVVDLFFWSVIKIPILSSIMLVVSICIGYVGLIIFLWLYPVLAKFENPFLVNLKNAAAMAVAHFFPYTFVISLILGVIAFGCYRSLAADLIMLLLGFSFLAYIFSFFFYKVFAKYIQEEPIGDNDPLYHK